jgi:DNA-binding NarL/FixJ family response regulator
VSEHEPLPDRAWFTPLLNRIADAAGDRAALILGREQAGRQIYVPGTMTPDHWLAELLGLEAASALTDRFGSQYILIPPALAGDKRKRASLIAQLADKGYSISKIVQMTGLSRSTVADHMQRHRASVEDPQGKLF